MSSDTISRWRHRCLYLETENNRLERKVRDLVDHVALLRSPQVTADDILRSRLEAAQRRIKALEARLLETLPRKAQRIRQLVA